jgi:hypothetical protein
LEDCSRWDVIVWNGPSIVLWERVDTEEIARARSDEYWALMVAGGWEPAEGDPNHTGGGPEPFRRKCAECGERAGAVTHRRNAFIVVTCEACGWRSRDHARTARYDRRHGQREHSDRRRAA